MKPPTTRQEAEKTRYGQWAGNPGGHAFNPCYCAYEVTQSGRVALQSQCGNKPGHGPEKLYCKAHAVMVDPPKSYTAWVVNVRHGHRCEPMEIIGESEKFVTTPDGRRSAKATEWARIFTNEDEAKAFAIKRAEDKIAAAERTIAEARKFIATLKPTA